MDSTTPDLTGFAEAQDRKRTLLGSPITFLWPTVVTFAPSVPLNPLNGQPFDATVLPTASSQASASATASVFFKAVNRGGAAGAEISAPIGHDDRTRVFLTLAQSAGALIDGATEFIFHGDRFKIYSVKDDEIVGSYVRVLVYGAAIGADTDSGFKP